MKKLLVGITGLVVFCMLGTTALAGPSAPKSVCYEWVGFLPSIMMTLKAQGTIKTADGPVKLYSINGIKFFNGVYPPATITGTATFIDGILRFSHISFVRSGGNPGTNPSSYWQMPEEGTFNPATGTGLLTSAFVIMPTSGGAVTTNLFYNTTIQAVDCKSLNIDSISSGTSSDASQQGESVSGMERVK